MRAVVPAIALLLGLPVRAPHVEAQHTTVTLAPHAENTFPGGDTGPTSAGEARARALVGALQYFRLDGVVVPVYRPIEATASLAAATRGLFSIVVPVGPTGVAHAESAATAYRRRPPHSAVPVVGHSSTIGSSIAAPGSPEGENA